MKKCLFIAPATFGYEQRILSELQRHFQQVVYVDERIGNTTSKKAISRFAQKYEGIKIVGPILNSIKAKFTKIHYEKFLSEINEVDLLLCIVPETIPIWFIDEVKKKNPNLKSVLYMWDSFEIRPYALNISKHFDKVYTFDRGDSMDYSIELLPLFYSKEYSNQEDTKISKKYQFSFIGTAHSDRYYIANKLNEMIGNKGFVFLFLQSKLQYFHLKIVNPKFRKSKLSDFHFESMGAESIVSVVNESSAILDIQHPNQVGLTMRTIEIALGMRKKLITTNSNIESYDFFNENNILIIDRENLKDIDLKFFESEYMALEESIYEKYSIENWVSTLIK